MQQAISVYLRWERFRRKAVTIPHELSEDNKNRRRDAALTLLSKFWKKDFLLHKIITGDGKLILYDNPKRRKSWVEPGSFDINAKAQYPRQEGFALYLMGLERCVVLRVVTTG